MEHDEGVEHYDGWSMMKGVEHYVGWSIMKGMEQDEW